MLILVGGAVVAAILGVASLIQGTGTNRVWSPEHGHYHDANGLRFRRYQLFKSSSAFLQAPEPHFNSTRQRSSSPSSASARTDIGSPTTSATVLNGRHLRPIPAPAWTSGRYASR